MDARLFLKNDYYEIRYEDLLDNPKNKLEKLCKYHKLVNVKSIGDDGDLELSYYVKFKKPSASEKLVQELKKLEGIQHINLFFDEEFF